MLSSCSSKEYPSSLSTYFIENGELTGEGEYKLSKVYFNENSGKSEGRFYYFCKAGENENLDSYKLNYNYATSSGGTTIQIINYVIFRWNNFKSSSCYTLMTYTESSDKTYTAKFVFTNLKLMKCPEILTYTCSLVENNYPKGTTITSQIYGPTFFKGICLIIQEFQSYINNINPDFYIW